LARVFSPRQGPAFPFGFGKLFSPKTRGFKGIIKGSPGLTHLKIPRKKNFWTRAKEKKGLKREGGPLAGKTYWGLFPFFKTTRFFNLGGLKREKLGGIGFLFPRGFSKINFPGHFQGAFLFLSHKPNIFLPKNPPGPKEGEIFGPEGRPLLVKIPGFLWALFFFFGAPKKNFSFGGGPKRPRRGGNFFSKTAPEIFPGRRPFWPRWRKNLGAPRFRGEQFFQYIPRGVFSNFGKFFLGAFFFYPLIFKREPLPIYK